MRTTLTAILCLFFSMAAYSQSLITGSVRDEGGLPFPGVTIMEKNTTNGVISDVDGNFSVRVADDAVLVFSYIGYTKKEVSVTGKESISIDMALDNEQIDEVVVIGYGSVTRDKISSSMVTVEGEELSKTTASNSAEALQGKAAGVQVISAGGSPGASPQIVIRGVTTANGTSPLIVVDGVMLPSGSSLNLLNPNDIETFQILKDASATAIYGSRASNGVILVTTKRGKAGRSTVSVDFSYGLQHLKKIEMAGADEYIQVVNQRRTNDGASPLYDPADYTTDTDWWDETIENYAPVIDGNVRIAGGNDKLKFSGSLGMFDQESNYTKGWYQKATARFNVDYKISKRVSFKQDINPRFERWQNTPSLLYSMLRIDPLTEVYLPESEREGRNQYSIYAPSNNNVPNPVGTISRQFYETLFFGFLSNSQLDIEIAKGLTFSSQFGLNVTSSRSDVFIPEYEESAVYKNEVNSVTRNTNQRLDYVFNNTLNYVRTFNEKHYMNLMGGVLFDSQNYNYLNAYREDVPDNDNPDMWYIDAATGDGMSVNSNETQDNIFSTVFRGLYSYNDKYFFTGSARVDMSSRFAKGNRTGFFPSASVAWDIDSEDFFNSGVIQNFRIKAGIGTVGNQNISRTGQFFTIGSGDYAFGGDRVVTNYLSTFGNPNLKWETVTDMNLGLEMSFFNNSLTFSGEVYQKTSSDLLFNSELPNYTGIPGTVAQNVGSFQSKGVDLQFGYNKQFGDFTLGLGLNLSTNTSVAKELAPGNEQIYGQLRSDLGNRYIKITEEGETVGLLYGYKTSGIFQNQTELNSHTSEDGTKLQPNAVAGDLRFEDTNGDGVLDDSDMQVIGDPFADLYGGLNIDLRYKKIDFSMQWYGTYGNDVFNYPSTFLYSGTQDVNVAKGTINKVWTEDNPGAKYPRLTQQDLNGNYLTPSDLFVEDASYLRLRNVQLGYNFDIRGVQRFRVYVSGQNLLTFTGYSGFDPEVAAGSDIITDYGIDYARNPVAKMYLIGINLTF